MLNMPLRRIDDTHPNRLRGNTSEAHMGPGNRTLAARCGSLAESANPPANTRRCLQWLRGKDAHEQVHTSESSRKRNTTRSEMLSNVSSCVEPDQMTVSTSLSENKVRRRRMRVVACNANHVTFLNALEKRGRKNSRRGGRVVGRSCV